MALFEGYERRINQILPALKKYGFDSLEDAKALCEKKGLDVPAIVRGVQSICFDNACWAYTVGAAIAIKKGESNAVAIARALGEGLQAFCIPGSVADERKVGLGHGNLAAMLLSDETKCFCFLAGHESFAAAEGAIGIAKSANRARKVPLRVILDGLGKDPALIISRINGFTYVDTAFDYSTSELKIVSEKAFSKGDRATIRCYGVDDVREGVAVMSFEGVDVSITGNSTNANRFQHPVAGTYKKECVDQGKKVFLGRLRRRHGTHPAPRQHGRRPRVLRHDRHDGAHAFGRPVRGLLLGAGPRGDDGPHRHGQQSDGGASVAVAVATSEAMRK